MLGVTSAEAEVHIVVMAQSANGTFAGCIWPGNMSILIAQVERLCEFWQGTGRVDYYKESEWALISEFSSI